MTYTDRSLTCVQCGNDFTFTADDQEFHAGRGYQDPKRCPSCRAERRNQSGGGSYGGSSSSSSYGGGYESYDRPRLISFLADVKGGQSSLSCPIYSHLKYDIVPATERAI